jgi:hypothetical protein
MIDVPKKTAKGEKKEIRVRITFTKMIQGAALAGPLLTNLSTAPSNLLSSDSTFSGRNE